MSPMALYLKDPEVDRAVRELAALEHCSITEAVGRAVEARRRQIVDEREEKRRKVEAILEEIWRLPILDDRDHGEMLYDEDGLPK
jgi:antitoxin VapB